MNKKITGIILILFGAFLTFRISGLVSLILVIISAGFIHSKFNTLDRAKNNIPGDTAWQKFLNFFKL